MDSRLRECRMAAMKRTKRTDEIVPTTSLQKEGST